MGGIAVRSFLSAAAGTAVLLAPIRALATRGTGSVVLLNGTVMLTTLLTHQPALAFGPIVEQLTMAGAAH
ncbi:potassium-transporting ATPase A subunit [Burkholderia thailandensis USAMRU Malaysia |nr:potassium-transporting ATPase A subunit [Burkholderia thailandensis E444]AIC90998.1 potassium-transporting ATPase A subunit [Burkholderia thailandensis USAMRU Malaysia \